MKEIHGWLRMVATGGSYPLPISESSYRTNSNRELINVAIPTNGGRLANDGTWEQMTERINNSWAQSLPELSARAGQQYIPSVGATVATLTTVLGNDTLWSTAADELVGLAQTRDFDSPWDGVVYDAIDVAEEDVEAHGDFVLTLSTTVRQAGLPFHFSYYGVTKDDPTLFPISVVAQAADLFIYYLYAWWIQPRMVSPYWWCRKSLDYALNEGVAADRIVLGVALYSTYWPVAGGGTRHDMTYSSALDIVHNSNTTIEWMENSQYGLVREKHADTGLGYVAITDSDTLRHKLDLVDEYGLRGIMLFTPGLEGSGVWDLLSTWKHGQTWRQTAQKLYGTGGLFSRG